MNKLNKNKFRGGLKFVKPALKEAEILNEMPRKSSWIEQWRLSEQRRIQYAMNTMNCNPCLGCATFGGL